MVWPSAVNQAGSGKGEGTTSSVYLRSVDTVMPFKYHLKLFFMGGGLAISKWNEPALD